MDAEKWGEQVILRMITNLRRFAMEAAKNRWQGYRLQAMVCDVVTKHLGDEGTELVTNGLASRLWRYNLTLEVKRKLAANVFCEMGNFHLERAKCAHAEQMEDRHHNN